MSGIKIVLHGREVSREAMLRFKLAYIAAVEGKQEQFKFDDQPVLTAYAKFVVEYAESLMGALE